MDTLGSIGRGVAAPFTGERAGENLLLMASLLAPRMRLSGWNRPWQAGEGEGLRQGLLAMSQFSREGRKEKEAGGSLRDVIGIMTSTDDPMGKIAALASSPTTSPNTLKLLAEILPSQQKRSREMQYDTFLNQPMPPPFLPSTESVEPGRVNMSLGDYVPYTPADKTTWKADRLRRLATGPMAKDYKGMKALIDVANTLEVGPDPAKLLERERFTNPTAYANRLRKEKEATTQLGPREQAEANALTGDPQAMRALATLEAAMAGAKHLPETDLDRMTKYISLAEKGLKVEGHDPLAASRMLGKRPQVSFDFLPAGMQGGMVPQAPSQQSAPAPVVSFTPKPSSDEVSTEEIRNLASLYPDSAKQLIALADASRTRPIHRKEMETILGRPGEIEKIVNERKDRIKGLYASMREEDFRAAAQNELLGLTTNLSPAQYEEVQRRKDAYASEIQSISDELERKYGVKPNSYMPMIQGDLMRQATTIFAKELPDTMKIQPTDNAAARAQKERDIKAALDKYLTGLGLSQPFKGVPPKYEQKRK